MRLALLLLAFSATLGASALAQVPTPSTSPAPEPFATQKHPPAPDYALAQNWAATPARPGAMAAVAPGATPMRSHPEVDVFYITPTTFRDATHWNQDVADSAANAWTDASVVARQGGVFNGCCAVYAPRYRQASLLSGRTMAGDGGKGFDLAYGDVRRAFEYYLQHYNHGRPFIIVGHSQGGFHAARLLTDEIDGKPQAARLVAAYVVGYNLSEGDFGKTYKTLAICDTPAQTGCVVSWNSVLPEAANDKLRGMAEKRYVDKYGDDPSKRELCVNPLTFDRARPEATTEQSLGVAPGDPGFGPLKTLVPHAVTARCDNGLLIVNPIDGLDMKPLPGGSMHYHDLGLFYADIRANAVLRSDAYLKAHPAAR